MSKSKALLEFEKAIAMAEALLELEKGYKASPPQKDQAVVQGLRGGVAVLMVASFEAYLRRAFIEYLSELTKVPRLVEFDKLPVKLRVNSIFSCLQSALKGPKYQDTTKIDRLPGIKQVCARVAADTLDPEALSSTAGNPDSETVKGLFSDIGVHDLFGTIHQLFRKEWGRPIATTFVKDKLDEIVQRRHRVAHTGNALEIGRSDLQEAIKFLKVLTVVLDSTLREHIEDITKS